MFSAKKGIKLSLLLIFFCLVWQIFDLYRNCHDSINENLSSLFSRNSFFLFASNEWNEIFCQWVDVTLPLTNRIYFMCTPNEWLKKRLLFLLIIICLVKRNKNQINWWMFFHMFRPQAFEWHFKFVFVFYLFCCCVGRGEVFLLKKI